MTRTIVRITRTSNSPSISKQTTKRTSIKNIPPLQKDLNRARYQSQNQNTLETNRQIIHPRRNRILQTPRVQFNVPHSPIANPRDLSSSPNQSTPQTPTQQNTSKIPSDYLGSTPASERIRENPFNPQPLQNISHFE